MDQEQVSLRYTDGSSDKVYHTQLAPQDGGFVVNFQYGRRGGTLQTGTKTLTPVSYDQAKKVYDTLVAAKKRKGYTDSEDGTPYQGSALAGQQSGLVPQLLNAIDETTVKAMGADDAWMLQEKIDGVRCMVRCTFGTVEGSNRKGLVIPLPAPVVERITMLLDDGQAVLDGELVGDVYHVFDLLELNGGNLRPSGAEERYDRLAALFGDDDDDPNVTLVVAFMTSAGKQEAFARLKAERAEGVVFKRKDSPYVPGRPNSGGNQLKFKFKASATVHVDGQNLGKRSVMMSVRTGAFEARVAVGSVTIPVNCDIPVTNTFIEVEYLYAYPGGSLFQPVYKGPREDKDQADHERALKFKQGTSDEDENES